MIARAARRRSRLWRDRRRRRRRPRWPARSSGRIQQPHLSRRPDRIQRRHRRPGRHPGAGRQETRALADELRARATRSTLGWRRIRRWRWSMPRRMTYKTPHREHRRNMTTEDVHGSTEAIHASSCGATRTARSRRRHFLGVTGLGLATAVLARAMPELVGTQAGLRRQYRRPGLARHLAELSRPDEFRQLQGS